MYEFPVTASQCITLERMGFVPCHEMADHSLLCVKTGVPGTIRVLPNGQCEEFDLAWYFKQGGRL